MDTSLDLSINLNNFPQCSARLRPPPPTVKLEPKTHAFPDGHTAALLEELSRVSSENTKLTKMLTTVCENYNALQAQFNELLKKNKSETFSDQEAPAGVAKKRKADCEEYNSGGANMIGFAGTAAAAESISSEEESSEKKPRSQTIKPHVSRVCVRSSPSNRSLIVRDGYQWRKYGQKVTRDNPSPRAYFKCSFAPTCPVKKKVQRSAEDPPLLVATYEGEHNHEVACPADHQTSGMISLTVKPAGGAKSSSSVTTAGLDLMHEDSGRKMEPPPPAMQQILVQQMATSLTRDPNFTAALAAAISGRVLGKIEK